MDIYGKRFIYAGTYSSTKDMIVALTDSDAYRSVHGEEKTESFFNRKSKQLHYLGTTWDDSPSSFSVELVKTTSGAYSASDVRIIEKWLFHQSSNKKFYIDPADDPNNETSETIGGAVKRLYANCRFTNPTKLMYNGGVVGFSATMECDCGWVWQDAITQTSTFNTTSNTVIVSVDSDIPDYTYPRIVLKAGTSGGDITIVNQTDDSTRITSLDDIAANATIVMNSAINYITDGYYDSFPNQNFVRLLTGNNTLSITGDVSEISITWSNMRYW